MLSLVDRIQAQIHSLRKAFSQLDWEMVTLLDKQSRILVKEVQATGKWDNSELHRGIVELSQLYSELQLAGRAERERLMSELTRMNQSKQVSQAYTLLG
ncbi:MAG: flagellar protein FliT [Pseudomonas sp.]|nr:flagellar protein FliT [Pseudomonas sp.]HBS80822.1 flagellar protein FliT [Pseudomonas sp.]|tara:strand:- start:23273 stop:23569 length:297 start_codon:yes stop_codon:yes gene_type:complete